LTGSIVAVKSPPPYLPLPGDLLELPLEDGSAALVQVLARAPERIVNLCLFASRARDRRDKVAAVVNATEETLLSLAPRLVGHVALAATPFSGPCGHPLAHGGILCEDVDRLAAALFGLEPWDDAFWRGLLLPGVTPPTGSSYAVRGG
jgi:hypothetical protein